MALPREISQRELRNDSGEVMRGLERGESFIVTRNGVPIGTLAPLRTGHFTPAAAAVAAFRGASPIDYERFRADIDAHIDQDPTPRA
jgi:antitoxin (DNA-binding transcriptional repressor) of toxin-antitoxin stability system